MSSAQLRQLFRSTSFRLSLLSGLVIAIAFALAGFGAWVVTKSAAEQAAHERIVNEMDALEDEMREEGIAPTLAAIRARQRSPGALDYLVLGPDGAIVAGDLRMPTPQLGWSTLYLPDSAGGADLVVFTQMLPDGTRLVIAQDLERTEGVRYAVLRTLLWVGLGAMLLSIGVGYLVARGALRRMDGLFHALERVSAGDLSARAPPAPANASSDVDLLGGRINGMLERIDTLVSNLRRVSTDIAHDLRTPLTHVRQQLETISAANDLDIAREGARVAQAKIDDLMGTFQAILRLAEIEAGAARSRFSAVDLGILIERIADAYRPDIENGGGSLTVETQAPGVVQGDADLLTHAVANLLDNALAHAPAGAAIKLRLREADGGVSLQVEDNGPGVPADDRVRVLEPFVRLDRSRGTPGVGLGLSIVHAVARLHGAQITIEDAGPGLRVNIGWPAAA